MQNICSLNTMCTNEMHIYLYKVMKLPRKGDSSMYSNIGEYKRIEKLAWYNVVILACSAFLFLSCSTLSSSQRSFIDPSYQKGQISKLAIFPLRNSRILPGESNEIIREMTLTINSSNQSIEIINSQNVIDLLSENNETENFSNFLRDYAASGIANKKYLLKLGDLLNCDAILQGEILDIVQQNGHYPGVMAVTSVTLRWYILSTQNGSVIWESSCSISKNPEGMASVWTPPVPIVDVIREAQAIVIKTIPEL